MPFSSQQIADAAMVGLDFYMKNDPIDQIKVDRPFYKAIMAGKKSFAGAKQYVVEQLRDQFGSNFQFYNGGGEVTYNERKTIKQVQYPWRSAHDGFMIDEDRLSQNGIIVNDSGTSVADDAERIQLTNLLQEHIEVLRLGFEEKFSAYLHLDGTSGADAIAGLDALVACTAVPTAAAQQVVGGIDRFSSPWWQHQVNVSTAQNVLLDKMEEMWRRQSVFGKPNRIFAGGAFIDDFRAAATAATALQRFQQVPSSGGVNLDPSVTGLSFHGVPIEYCPEFDDAFGGMGGAPTPTWTKRCYMLDMKHLKLRPLAGQDMVSRKPPRPHNRYVMYQALTWKGAMTLNFSRTQGVLGLD